MEPEGSPCVDAEPQEAVEGKGVYPAEFGIIQDGAPVRWG